jgi:hypothetical protein
METDAKRFPKLGRELIKGGLDSVSMGVEAGFTICSVCDNKATDESNMCDHILFHKGEYMKNKKTGKRTLVYEKCYKLGFFELSYVFDPADETAVVSRVISAGKKEANDTAEVPWNESGAHSVANLPEGHRLSIFSPTSNVSPLPGQTPKPAQWEWVHEHGQPHPGTHIYNYDVINHGVGANAEHAKQEAWKSYEAELAAKRLGADEWDPNQDLRALYSKKFVVSAQGLYGAELPAKQATSRQKKRGGQMSQWYKRADVPRLFKTEVPDSPDTLRDESEDDTDLFHHWVESPPELQAPSMDQTKLLDQQQEAEGLDEDRNAENAEEFGAPSGDQGQQPADPNQPQFLDEEEQDPVMPINPPEVKKSRRTQKEIRMSRYFYADEDESYDDPDGGGDDETSEDFGGEDEGAPEDDGGDGSDDGGSDDIGDLLDQAEADIDAFESQEGLGDDSGGEDEFGGNDEGYGDDTDEYADEDAGAPEEGTEDTGDSQPPWLQEGRRGPVRSARSRRNQRGGTMRTTLASRDNKARHFQAESGHTDGGPYGIDDSQGNQEDVFISQVPSAEAVEAPTPDDAPISNGPGNLVAYKRPQFDPNHYQRLADVVRALPPEQRGAMARKMVAMFTADNKAFNGQTFYQAAAVPVVRRGNRYFYAEDLVDPEKVDPGLSGTDVSDLKGDDFESLALEDVETQPKDASIHAFRAFDSWLQKATGRTARQHGNANFIRRAAATYSNQWKNPQAKLATLFPTLEFVLAEARKFEGSAQMRHHAEDKSLDVAAPQGRIDVEAPVKNVTDADAQASQFDLSDFAHNAGDQLADPVLDVVDGNAGTWAPDKGKESSRKLATGVEAVRLADAYIQAYPNTYSPRDRWTLTARFETLRQPVVRDRIRVLEAVIADNEKQRSKTARKVTAASSRGTKGLPVGLSNRRVATTRKASASDPDTDSALFI